MAPTLLDLANVGDDQLGATEAIKNLLQAVGRDIVSLQRNTNVSYIVAERAQDVAKAINDCIIEVEKSETEDWVNFEKFSNAIDPLEEVLLKLLSFADEEKELYLAETSSIVTCVKSPETWKAKREEISKILKEFHTTQGLVKLLKVPDTQENDKHAQFYDDKTLLEEMRTEIKAFLSKEPKEFPTYAYEIETPLNDLQDAVIGGSSPPEWLVILTIQTSMLIDGIAKIVETTSDIETRSHLKSKPVWDAALTLLNFLVDNKKQSNSPVDADKKYQAFITALTALAGVPLPENYVQLMRKVGHIRRPFQAQAITVVRLCHTLAEKFRGLQKSDINIKKFDDLEVAINKTLTALEGATKVDADLKAFNTPDLDNHPTAKEFGAAEDLIKESFHTLDLGKKWEENQFDLSNARQKDKTRLTELQERFNKGPSDPPALAKVTVTIHEDSLNGPELKAATSFDVEKTMRLTALRWSVAGELAEDKRHAARTTGTFFDQSGVEKRAHSTIGEIAGVGSVVTLKLVVPGAKASAAQELAAKTAAQERAAKAAAAQELAAQAAAQERAAKAAAAQERAEAAAAHERASKTAAAQERAAKAAAAQELAAQERAAQELALKAAAQERAAKAAAAQERAEAAAAHERAAKTAAAQERAAKAAAAQERAAKAAAKAAAAQERAAKTTTS